MNPMEAQRGTEGSRCYLYRLPSDDEEYPVYAQSEDEARRLMARHFHIHPGLLMLIGIGAPAKVRPEAHMHDGPPEP